MITKEPEIKKYCCFYASDFHLEMILLPNIKNNINKTKFVIFTEKDLSESIKVVLDKTNITEKEQILNLDWKNKNINELTESDCNNYTIIINGNSKYIENVNEKLKKLDLKQANIIDCYNIYEEDQKVLELRKKYDYVLNTKTPN